MEDDLNSIAGICHGLKEHTTSLATVILLLHWQYDAINAIEYLSRYIWHL